MEKPDIIKVIRNCEFSDYNEEKQQWIPCKEIATGERNIGTKSSEFYKACDKHKGE